jgi:hypothetical protein
MPSSMLRLNGIRQSPSRAVLLVAGAACAVLAALGSPTEASALEPCGKAGYSYAGFRSADRGHGVSATLVALARPRVSDGHVAAWVGVGGARQGPNGSDQWLQIGLSAFNGTGSRLYYEVATGGAPPRYHELVSEIAPGQRSRVAVLEMTTRPSWWRVWLNGKAVSGPIHMPGSSGRFHPIATAETWDGGVRGCNRFRYHFGGLRVASSRGGGWKPFVKAQRFLDRGYRVTTVADTSFVAAVV